MSERTRMIALRVVLTVVCVSHAVIGISIMFASDTFIESIGRSYGAERVPKDLPFLYMLKPLGAYMLAFAFLAAAAIVNPRQNRIAIDGAIFLLLIRVVQRFLFAGHAQEAFGITTEHRLLQSAFFLAIAAALFILRPRGEAPRTDMSHLAS